MKHIRTALAALLCAAAVVQCPAALAASGDVPSISLTVPADGVESGGANTLTVQSSLPGFLTLRLLDASGNEYATLAENQEIHSKENSVALAAVDEDGSPVPEGSYTLSAVVVSQFGVSSKTATANLKVTAAVIEENDEDEQAGEADESEADEKADAGEEVKATKTTSPAAKSTPKPASAQSTAVKGLTYTAGSGVIGEEGYEIGVGVSDTTEQTDSLYWSLDASASDEDIWQAIISPMTSVDVGENESAYIYNSVADGRKRLGTVSGLSHGVNVIEKRSDGWSLVETYRNEDGAFVRGYIRTKTLRTVEPNTTYGLVVDKSTQTLTVFKDGARIGSCAVTTGLPTEKYLQRETPAGEYVTVTRRGTLEYPGSGYTKYTIRINGSYYLCEIPTTKKNGTNYSLLEDSLGQKASRGSICLQNEPSSDGGINAEWIWSITDANKKVKVLIFDDKDRTDVPVGSK